jgi:hypothetical protein
VLQPNEEGKLEVFFDTRRFKGPKTQCLWLSMDNGMTTMFTISADAEDDGVWDR